MEQRRQVQRDRVIPIHQTMFGSKVTKERIITTLREVEDGEEIIDLGEVSGFREAGFRSMSDDPVHYQHWQITVRKYTPETDEEYLKRKKTEESYKSTAEERDKLEYLRLKAKYEPQEQKSQ